MPFLQVLFCCNPTYDKFHILSFSGRIQMFTRKIFVSLAAALMMASAMATVVSAAPVEITTSIKSSLDKTIAGSNPEQAGKINARYDEFLTLQKQQQEWDVKIKAVHTGNQETSKELSKQIKQIDAANLDKLEADVNQIRERYKPLLSLYSSLNKQIEAARSLKNNDLVSVLRIQANALKIPVQLARVDIKMKETAWQAAKKDASDTMKKIRGTLTDIEPVNVQIKARQSAIKSADTAIAPVWNTFKQSVKKRDAQSVLGAFESLAPHLRQINEEKQNIVILETKISDILAAAKKQIP
jgi:hypothetical protein